MIKNSSLIVRMWKLSEWGSRDGGEIPHIYVFTCSPGTKAAESGSSQDPTPTTCRVCLHAHPLCGILCRRRHPSVILNTDRYARTLSQRLAAHIRHMFATCTIASVASTKRAVRHVDLRGPVRVVDSAENRTKDHDKVAAFPEPAGRRPSAGRANKLHSGFEFIEVKLIDRVPFLGLKAYMTFAHRDGSLLRLQATWCFILAQRLGLQEWLLNSAAVIESNA